MVTHLRSLDDLSDEIIMLIVCQLADPASLGMSSKRLHRITQDPYVRASYFLARHGPQQALYWALGRGKLVNERVLDILLTSGAHLSRYLLQTAIHHYFRTTAHFIKHSWARTLPLPIFTHFMHLGTTRFGADVPLAKGEDDGAVFLSWLTARISPGFAKKVEFETVQELFEKYGFMVFAPKDPVSVQLPLAFALEPSLLPLAVKNGFHMDSKYRDFVFRKMFEKHNREGRVAEILRNVREMTRLDSSMFLSRTVAAEVCMECRTNEAGYSALKKLDAAGDLLFELKDLVHDLLKLFLKTRSITNPNTILTIQALFRDFPSPSYTPTPPRLVVLITIFCTPATSGVLYIDVPLVQLKLTPSIAHAKLEHLGVLPLTVRDLEDVLISPWCEKPAPIFAWAKDQMGMNDTQVQALAEDVAVRSLGVSCKGKLIRRLVDMYPSVRSHIMAAVKQYSIDLEKLPNYWADDDCERFRTGFNVAFGPGGSDMYTMWAASRSGDEGGENEDESDDGGGAPEDRAPSDDEAEDGFVVEGERISKRVLGFITQDSLTARLQLDSENGFRPRRRYWNGRYNNIQSDSQLKSSYPFDAYPIGQWVLDAFGPRHPVTAVFMTHAVANHNAFVLNHYLDDEIPRLQHVPVTLKHFKILARLGREPFWLMWGEIEHVDFYFSEEDYLDAVGSDDVPSVRLRSPTKVETKTPELPEQPLQRKRPRRSAASAAPSYVVPDSDDEEIMGDEGEYEYCSDRKGKGKARAESSLQVWIKHLTALLKEEEKKYKEKKKTIEKKENGKPKYRLAKSEFMKSLASHLREMRITERQRRNKETFYRRGGKVIDMDSDFDLLQESDDDYVLRRPKSRKKHTEEVPYKSDEV